MRAPCPTCHRLINWAGDGPPLCFDCNGPPFPAATSYRTELTPIGEQLCIPGTERQPVAGKPAQLSLFGG